MPGKRTVPRGNKGNRCGIVETSFRESVGNDAIVRRVRLIERVRADDGIVADRRGVALAVGFERHLGITE